MNQTISTTPKSKGPITQAAHWYMESAHPASKYFLHRLCLCISLLLLGITYSFCGIAIPDPPSIVNIHNELAAWSIIAWIFFIPTDIPTIKKVFCYFGKTIFSIIFILLELHYYFSTYRTVLFEIIFAFVNIFVLTHLLHMCTYLFKAFSAGIKYVFKKIFAFPPSSGNSKFLASLDWIGSIIISLSSIIASIVILLNSFESLLSTI